MVSILIVLLMKHVAVSKVLSDPVTHIFKHFVVSTRHKIQSTEINGCLCYMSNKQHTPVVFVVRHQR